MSDEGGISSPLNFNRLFINNALDEDKDKSLCYDEREEPNFLRGDDCMILP